MYIPHQHHQQSAKDKLNLQQKQELMQAREFIYGRKEYSYNAYPKWLEEEKARRKIDPELLFYVSGISITFLTPHGDEHTYKYFPFQKKALSLEDFARVVRSLEDRHLLEIQKTSFLSSMVENTNNQKSLDEIKLRLIKHANSKQEKSIFKKNTGNS